MNLKFTIGFIFFGLVIGIPGWSASARFTQQPAGPTQSNGGDENKFVYADFERFENGRVVSNNGGLIQLFTGQESTPVQFKARQCFTGCS
jgi:hypothetical protein